MRFVLLELVGQDGALLHGGEHHILVIVREVVHVDGSVLLVGNQNAVAVAREPVLGAQIFGVGPSGDAAHAHLAPRTLFAALHAVAQPVHQGIHLPHHGRLARRLRPHVHKSIVRRGVNHRQHVLRPHTATQDDRG